MDKLARPQSATVSRRNREDRPTHPSTRDLVFSLATCGSIFVLSGWSLTAVGCSAGTKTNEQRMAQRRNAGVDTTGMDSKQAAKLTDLQTVPTNAGSMPLTAGAINTASSNTASSNTGTATATTNAGTTNTRTFVAGAGTTTTGTTTGTTPVYNPNNANTTGFGSSNSVDPNGVIGPDVLASMARGNKSAMLAATVPSNNPAFVETVRMPNAALLSNKSQPRKTYLPDGTPALVDPSIIAATNQQSSNLTNNPTTNGWREPNYNPNAGTSSDMVQLKTAAVTGTINEAVQIDQPSVPGLAIKMGLPSNFVSPNSSSTPDGMLAVAPKNNAPSTQDTNEMSRLLAQAFAQKGAQSMDPMKVWFIYSSLAVSNPDIELPEGWGADLLPAERDRIAAAHKGFSALGRSFREGKSSVDSLTRQALVAALTGDTALTIPKVDLCSKISGYGDYSPIGGRNFRVGANNRVIVYSELDGFKSRFENGKWTTRLATRVSIVPVNGGDDTTNTVPATLAWCRTPEWTEVTDTSDKPRSEFFLGEIIPIGSSLIVGSYAVKVEVKDLSSGAVTSSIVPFQILDERTYAAVSGDRDNN
jgi:hypothetical protein